MASRARGPRNGDGEPALGGSAAGSPTISNYSIAY